MNAIRTQRLKAGMTQWQLAKAAGITTGAVWMLEHNQRQPTDKELAAIAAALNTDENTLRRKSNDERRDVYD